MIGDAPQTASPPDTSGRVVFRQFDVPSSHPLDGGVPLGDFVKDLESDTEMHWRLARARRELAEEIAEPGTFRRLRLKAGLSQARLAALATTTQTYIARVESGTLDPGTEMVARMASALGIESVTVFAAILAQRQASTRVG